MMEGQLIPVAKENNSTVESQEEEIVEVQDSSDRQESLEPKKLGRPIKSQAARKTKKPPQPPRRESQRIKKIRQTYDYTPAKLRCVWSNKEKLLLLKGLDEHGEKNIKGLMEYIPNRTDSEIRSQIKMWKEFGREEVEKKTVQEQRKNCNSVKMMLTKLDNWLEYFMSETEMSCSSQFALSNTLLLIAEYGKFPPPNECHGIDFRGLHRALHCMLNGTPYFGLNQATAKMLQSAFSTLTTRLRKGVFTKRFEPHLLNSTPRKRAIRNYGRPPYRGKLSAPTNADAVMQMPGMNPLNLPLSALNAFREQGMNNSDEQEEDSSEEDYFSDDE